MTTPIHEDDGSDPLADLRARALELAAQRASITADAAALAAQADAARAAASAASAVADASSYTTAQSTTTALHAQRREVLAGTADLDRALAEAVAALDRDPCDLEADVPLVLLPVRLETRYTADGSALRVRIYPDDAHVDRLDRGLSVAERAAGTAYWQAIWDGTVTEDSAWLTLVAAVQPSRAEWVAAALSPDLTTRPNPPVVGAVPVLADPPPLQQLPAVARSLPDRFVVVAVQGEQTSHATGAPVPPQLVVGLPPTADPDQLVQPDGQITLGPGMQWLVDPDEAERVGLLVTVPLAVPGGAVDRVLAFGVRGSLAPADAASELGALLQAHRYAEGASFVAPGTPTNNTETDRADWTARRTPAPPPTAPSPPAAGSAADAAATAWGIDAGGLATWPGSDGVELPLAQAANTALWQATWGTFIERIVAGSAPQPNLGDDQREAWRSWWQDHVRGGGPLPLLRLGDQPYGVLPASAVNSTWSPDGSDAFEAPMLAVLRNGRPLVEGALRRAPGPLGRLGRAAVGAAAHLRLRPGRHQLGHAGRDGRDPLPSARGRRHRVAGRDRQGHSTARPTSGARRRHPRRPAVRHGAAGQRAAHRQLGPPGAAGDLPGPGERRGGQSRTAGAGRPSPRPRRQAPRRCDPARRGLGRADP
jgi:hypothetical protein